MQSHLLPATRSAGCRPCLPTPDTHHPGISRCSCSGRASWQSTSSPTGSRRLIRLSAAVKEETATEAYERRLRESMRVEERVVNISTDEDFRKQLGEAGSKLVVLEVDSAKVCQTGLMEEPEIQYKQDLPDTLGPCQELKHLLQRTARDCPDVHFIHLDADTAKGKEACDALGVEVLPTLQFWRDNKLLWEHRGILQLQQDLGEGVLYYGDFAARGEKASAHVGELHNRAEFDQFIDEQDEKVLTIVDVSLQSAAPCIHIFSAVLALARSFKGYASFARLIGDSSKETEDIMREYEIVEVPTFLFFRNGKEIGRHVGSSRGDLIGQILMQQNALGIAPPPPPVTATRTKRPGSRRR